MSQTGFYFAQHSYFGLFFIWGHGPSNLKVYSSLAVYFGSSLLLFQDLLCQLYLHQSIQRGTLRLHHPSAPSVFFASKWSPLPIMVQCQCHPCCIHRCRGWRPFQTVACIPMSRDSASYIPQTAAQPVSMSIWSIYDLLVTECTRSRLGGSLFGDIDSVHSSRCAVRGYS